MIKEIEDETSTWGELWLKEIREEVKSMTKEEYLELYDRSKRVEDIRVLLPFDEDEMMHQTAYVHLWKSLHLHQKEPSSLLSEYGLVIGAIILIGVLVLIAIVINKKSVLN